jgi:hypothetical protein
MTPEQEKAWLSPPSPTKREAAIADRLYDIEYQLKQLNKTKDDWTEDQAEEAEELQDEIDSLYKELEND